MVLSPPYAIFLAFAAGAAYVAASHPEAVNADNGLYCAIHVNHFERFTTSIFCTVILLISSALEVAIAVKCYRDRRLMKKVCPDADVRRPSLSPYFRAIVVLVYSWITFGACILVLTWTGLVSPFPYMAEAALPLTAFIVFAVQEVSAC